MLDFFTIFSKGGIVLWCFQGTTQWFTPSVNSLIKSVVLQERTDDYFVHGSLKLKYKFDNKFELIFVVAYQNILQLSYVDKFLTDIQMEFRERYKNVLLGKSLGNASFSDFDSVFHEMLRDREQESKQETKVGRKMRTYEDSHKSKKTVSSMVENKNDEKMKASKGKENKAPKGKANGVKSNGSKPSSPMASPTASMDSSLVSAADGPTENRGGLDEETRQRNLAKLMNKGKKKSPSAAVASNVNGKSPEAPKKKGKAATKWNHEGTNRDMATLNYSDGVVDETEMAVTSAERAQVGKMSGQLRDIETESEDEEDFDDEEEDEDDDDVRPSASSSKQTSSSKSKSSGGGMFSMFRKLVGSKALTREDLQPALDKMKDHLIAKNVASDIALKLCDSVAKKLEGKIIGTFGSIANTVKTSLNESCVQILSPKRRIDILRDALTAKEKKRPYTVTFCGVNGVGKSTNLAKICFWLVENGFSVLIAACDTFRSGAVEQLRTHVRKLNALHPKDAHGRDMVTLYERGYGKDSAGIAMEAINSARDNRIDVVLVDTAGRMQDNEPLMRALSKLVKVNQPDLVLFVGEALVGNEAVDQLVKFNQALADFSQSEQPRLIDGIILTKFDTIDDKVGAAISMTYTTGQPVVFVGTGQTYSDLRNLNTKAVVTALLKG